MSAPAPKADYKAIKLLNPAPIANAPSVAEVATTTTMSVYGEHCFYGILLLICVLQRANKLREVYAGFEEGVC